MERGYLPFIDWFKCIGMVLIVYGHVAGWAPLAALPPIYTKQLGVAFFLFCAAYSLANESRSRWRVVYNRLFELYLFGLPLALLWSIAAGRLVPSNYLPFLGGLNVAFDNFPANPTTWYLGTYLHVMVLWGLFAHRLRVTPTVLAASLVLEIAVRTTVMLTAGRFVAYMLVPNWSTVLLLGYWYGCRGGQRTQLSLLGPAASGAVLASAIGVWSIVATWLPFERELIFMRWTAGPDAPAALIVAVMVSMVYLGITWMTFSIVGPLTSTPAAVRLVARNSLFIFLAHMPVFYVLAEILSHTSTGRLWRSTLYMVVCLPGLALVSEGLHRLIRPRDLRERLRAGLATQLAASPKLEALIRLGPAVGRG